MVDRHARLNRIGRTKVNRAQKKTPAGSNQARLDTMDPYMHDRSQILASRHHLPPTYSCLCCLQYRIRGM